MTVHNGITSGNLCALNILRLTVVTRRTESYTKTKCSAESVIPQSIFFALINLRYLINHYCFFADFFLTYNEEYVIMVQNRTILRKGRATDVFQSLFFVL